MKTFLTEPSTERERSVDAINGRDDGGEGGREVVDGARARTAPEVRGMSSGVVSRRRETVKTLADSLVRDCAMLHDLHLRLQLRL